MVCLAKKKVINLKMALEGPKHVVERSYVRTS
jgi:hypothetical protein